MMKDLRKKASVKIWKRQICLVYEKENGGVSLSQPFSTNIVVGKVVNGVQFQSQRQFSGTKRKKVNNFSCLMFQAGENEMCKLSNHQIWRDIHLPAFAPRHLVQQDTLIGIWIYANSDLKSSKFGNIADKLLSEQLQTITYAKYFLFKTGYFLVVRTLIPNPTVSIIEEVKLHVHNASVFIISQRWIYAFITVLFHHQS